jgi:hypothetical protein
VFVLVPADGGVITRANAVALPVSLLVEPVVAAVYFWLPATIADMVRSLRETGALRGPAVDREVAVMEAWQSSFLLPAFALLIAAALTLASVIGLPEGIPQYGSEVAGGRAVFSYVVGGAAYYAAAVSLLRALGVTYMLLRLRLASQGMEFGVDPNHWDDAGGWGTLGSYLVGQLLAVASAVVAVSIVLYTGTLKEAWQQLLLVGGLLLVAISLVGAPVWLAHTMMRPARRASVAEIRTRRRSEYEAMRGAVTTGDGDASVASQLDILRSLDEAERYVRSRYPVVPFRRPALLTLNTVTTISVVLGTTSTAVALFRTLGD